MSSMLGFAEKEHEERDACCAYGCSSAVHKPALLLLCVYCSMDPERLFFPYLDMWSGDRHPRLNSTSDPFLTGLPCSGTVNSLTQLWNAPSVSSQGKLYICFAHPCVLHVPTVLLIQTRAPIVIFARADPDSSVSPSVLPEASPCGGVLQMKRLPRRLGIQQPRGTQVIAPAHVTERGGSRWQSGPNRGVNQHMGIMPPAGTAPRKFYTRSSPASETKQRSACYVHENPSPLPSRITFQCSVSSIDERRYSGPLSAVFLLFLPVITLISATTFDGTKQHHCILTDRLEF